jgi:hypothetical protein
MPAITNILNDTCVVVISKRPAPVMTLQSHSTNLPVLLLADPEVYSGHKSWVMANNLSNVKVICGKVGMVAQIIEAYKQSAKHGYKFYFRMDDDIRPNCFVLKQGCIKLDNVILATRICASDLGVSLVGLQNSCNRLWLKDGFGLTFGHVTGGSHLCCSAKDPSEYIDSRIQYSEDVYRTLAHRVKHGAVGRVRYIGFDKRESCRYSVCPETVANVVNDKKIILERFSGLVSCVGKRLVAGPNGVSSEVTNWRMLGRVSKTMKRGYYA